MLAARRAPREPSLHEIPRSFIAPHRQVSLTPHEACVRLILPGALPRFTRENQTFFKRSKISPRIFRIEVSFYTIFCDNRKKYLNNESFLAHFLEPGPTQHGVKYVLRQGGK